ncbi:MAG: saccharopine dehydrogenase NADP-binding domain-containing protein [Bacteroidales bacterium]|nr:saccharopine dehydrogenase NADP-binding domain-containing protein [Bacteroidales bacterium]
MKKISILGAGLSTTSLIDYLLERAEQYNWQINVGDCDISIAKSKIGKYKNATAFDFNVNNSEQVEKTVIEADIVVSMLPASFHYIIAQSCVKHKTQMLTASYVSKEIKDLEQAAKESKVGIYMELGVDPGIDHMSAMRIIDKLRNDGSTLNGFFSSTGGLVAPEYDNNPWHYKFTWNPRNVVLAGQGVSMFIRNGRYKYIPYQRLFHRLSETTIEGYGDFEIYPNRDSLKYRKTYGLETIPTIFRGTMRRKGFARAWNVFVQLGATDDSYAIENSENMTFRQFINNFLAYEEHTPLEEKIRNHFSILITDDVYNKLKWLDIFEDIKIPLKEATPAQILQYILERKLQLEEGDKDMIVMQHRFEFTTKEGKEKEIVSTMVVKGETKEKTAMAITVGTPLAIAVKMVANNELNLTGVHVPVIPEMYNPILDELENLDIKFTEVEK